MAPGELNKAIDWAASEGWNPGLHDAESFYSADPSGYFVGELDGEIIATVSAVKYDTNFGFVGLYIVAPEFRHRGYGIEVWRHALAYLEDVTIGLDGVAAQEANYKSSGFSTAHTNIRYAGRIEAPSNDVYGAKSPGVQQMSIDRQAISAFDRRFFPAKRESFLEKWLQQPNSKVEVVARGGDLTAYGVIRQCRTGFKIGPLFATSEKDAELIFGRLASAARGEVVFLDTPEPNSAGKRLAEKHNMQAIFETRRMYTKRSPVLPLDQIYGITTFELG
jgi:GNAT superfamily N-acetyltransferase